MSFIYFWSCVGCGGLLSSGQESLCDKKQYVVLIEVPKGGGNTATGEKYACSTCVTFALYVRRFLFAIVYIYQAWTTETRVFAKVPSTQKYLAKTVDVPGIVYVVAFKVELIAETPVV